MRTKRTRRIRRKRSRRKIKRGGDSRNTWLPSFLAGAGRDVVHQFDTKTSELLGKYQSASPNPTNQPLIKF